jgi:type I restriction enzyme S subunit
VSRWKIPIGWQWAKVSEIALIVGGGTPPSKNPVNFAEKGIPWLTPADLSNYQEEYIDRGKRDLSQEGYRISGAQLMPKDSVLFTSRAPIGYCVLAANEISTNQGFKSLILKGNINPKYIRHYLLSSKQYAESLASGSTFKELSGHRMVSLEIPIPPLNEQKRIVARIEELQVRSRRAREALEAIPDLLEQLRQSILAAAFRGDLTKEWRESHPNVEPATELLKRIRVERRKRWEAAELEKLKAKRLSDDKLQEAFAISRKQYKEPVPVDTARLPEIPEGWCWAKLENVCKKIMDGTHYSPVNGSTGDRLYLTAKNIRPWFIEMNTVTYVSEKDHEAIYSRCDVQYGDVLYVKDGVNAGMAALNILKEPFSLLSSVGVFRPEEGLLTQYIVSYLNSPMAHTLMLSQVSGNAITRLTLIKLRNSLIPVPPLDEQEKIALMIKTQLFNISSLLRKTKVMLNQIKNLDHAILSKAFRGELVPQDPNDEPASSLLERIKQEKARVVTEPKSKDKRKGKIMQHKQEEQRDILAVLRKSGKDLTPEEVFSAAGFDEASVDIFYEQLREAVASKHIREIKEGNSIRLEAIVP